MTNASSNKNDNTGRKIIVVIPAFNEEATIAKVVKDVKEILPETFIAVIDDGSSDHTGEVADQAGAHVFTLPYNIGIGGAVQTGLRFAKREDFDFVVRIDGDGQHFPSDIPRLLQPVMSGEADVAIGSRFFYGGWKADISIQRKMGIYLFATLASALSGKKITDPTSGFIIMNKRSAEFLANNLEQDYPEVDSRVSLVRAGFRVLEFPVEMRVRQGGVSSINTIRAIYYVIKVTLSILIAKTRNYI